MSSDSVQQIKDRLSIVDVVSGYVKLERAGQNMRARCPFHAEKTPSFIVSPDRGTYHCFGCGVGGDIFSFVEAIEGIDFKGALKMLADRAGVTIEYAKGEKGDDKDRLFAVMEAATLFYQKKLDTESEKYVKGRGLTDATIRAFRLGFAADGWTELSDHLRSKKFTDKEILDAGLAKKGDRGLTDKFRNRIMFPIADTAGRIVAFSGRTFGAHAHPDAPKYLNSPETPLFHKSRILYGFDRAKQSIRKYDCSILVEGQMDLILSHQAGWANTVAVSGTAFTVEHAALLKRMSDNLIIALDADEAGLKATARSARAALQQGLNVKVVQMPQGVDPADLIHKEGVEAWKKHIREAKDVITFLLDVLHERAKAPDAFRRTVEAVVLPFVSEVQSPIAREQYEQEIARRLGVSESAIAAARAKVPTAPREETATAPSRSPSAPNRATQAYGLLLWQKTLKEPVLDVASFAQHLEEAIGNQCFAELDGLDESEKERLRFHAERVHEGDVLLARDAQTFLTLLTRERLESELQENTAALRAAEAEGNEAAVAEYTGRTQMLVHAIAQIGKEE